LFAAAALTATAGAQEIHNWKSAAGDVWKNASGECWRDGSWTPATAAPGCDGALMAPKAEPALARSVFPDITSRAFPIVNLLSTGSCCQSSSGEQNS
jgi:OOP family OmpA-OmpF porin